VAQQYSDDHLDGPGRTALLAGVLLFVLALLVTIADGVGSGLAVLGLAVLAGGAAWLVRGRTRGRQARTTGRRVALGVAAAGLLGTGIGTAVTPPAQETAAQQTAPGTAAPAPAPNATPQSSSPQTRPVMAMSCPPGSSLAEPVFGRQITATRPYSVVIDYGDGDVYTNDDRHLGAIFSHTYREAGSFRVTAVLTDSAGQTAAASCSYRWTSPDRATATP
jgi:PKD domain-containing protein